MQNSHDHDKEAVGAKLNFKLKLLSIQTYFNYKFLSPDCNHQKQLLLQLFLVYRLYGNLLINYKVKRLYI
jgi:hypothetical protein